MSDRLLPSNNFDAGSQEEIDYLVSLDAMATVGRNHRDKLLIQVHPPESQSPDTPYFKLFNAAQEQHATHMARIRFDAPVYEIYAVKYNRGKDYWWLSPEDKVKLIRYLDSGNMNLPKFTNWQYAILAYNNEKGLDFYQTQANLLADPQLRYPGFIPFDLPRPNYELLAPNAQINEMIRGQIVGNTLRETESMARRILGNQHDE